MELIAGQDYVIKYICVNINFFSFEKRWNYKYS